MAIYQPPGPGSHIEWTRPTGYQPDPVTWVYVQSSPRLRGRKLLAYLRKNAWRIKPRARRGEGG